MVDVRPDIMTEMEADVIKMIEGLPLRPNVTETTAQEIRSEAEKYGTKTKFENYNFGNRRFCSGLGLGRWYRS